MSLYILPEKTRNFSYYEKLLPLYLQEEENFKSHFKILFDVFFAENYFDTLVCSNETICSDTTICGTAIIKNSVVSAIDKAFALLDIFGRTLGNRTYGSYVDMSANESDALDKLAALFGISRNFSVTIADEKIQLSLNNQDLLTFIKCQVIKNYFNGTFAELEKYYKDVNLPILCLTDSTTAAHCKMYMLLSNNDEISENIKNLFLSGKLSVESLGIYYSYSIQTATNIAIFDSTIEASSFDYGQFVI